MEIPGPNIITWQSEVIREIAKRGDCVIVGRAADAILSDENPFKIFVYADNQSKIERCRKRAPEDEHLTDKEIEKKIKKIDKSRATNHDLVSSYSWGNREGFDLMVNTSGTDLKNLIKPLAEYALAWFAK
jgi:cytidylate kinase